MLSPFLKKLLFVRQFVINEGKIEILGQSQIMLPSDLLAEIQMIDHDKVYNIVKKHINSSMKKYSKKIGSTSSGLIKTSQDIFDTFGLGHFQIEKLDNKKKIANVAIKKSSICESCKKMKKENKECCLLEAAVDGMFSFLFNSQVEVQTKGNNATGKQFTIKSKGKKK